MSEMTATKVQVESRPGGRMVDTATIPWTEFPFPGTRFKLLNINDHNDALTMILRVDRGVQTPIHKHLGAVEVYTIEGNWSYQEGEVGAGGYSYEPNGVIHQPASDTDLEMFIVAHGPVLNLTDDGDIAGIIDNDVLYDLAKANNAIGHLPPRYPGD
jgi:anti-sigma factor ChrR (cupin superfamily)